jgi:hypothetical protein
MNEVIESKKQSSKYTYLYRVLKTILFHCAYLSLGLNSEIYGVTSEDLKILLNVNYQRVASLYISKVIGFLIFLPIFGLIIDPFLKYSDFLIALANLGIALRKLFFE